MITDNVIQRTFHIRWNASLGSAFTIDRYGRQYLLTARHVVEGISSGNEICIWHKGWKEWKVDVIGIGGNDVDVAILSCDRRLSPTHPLEASAAGLACTQIVYFLGFPFGWKQEFGQMNHGYPIPFVKSGIVSGFSGDNIHSIYIDGHVNPGFSGGPVVFRPQNGSEFRVAGIVSGSLNSPTPPTVFSQGRPIVHPDLVRAIDIRHAVELIDENPRGPRLVDE